MFQTKPPVAAALALALATATGGVLANPHRNHPYAADRVDARVERMTEQLDLSADQQQEIRAMLDAHQKAEAQARAELRQRIDAVLTDEQRQRRDEQRQARAERRLDRLADRLDLSDTQREEVAAIFAQKRKNPQMTRSEVRNALAGVLTEEQIARLDALRDRHQSARHGGRGGDFPDRR